ncbi:hypothetical protein L1987_07048 [Smallanthus sonchifolius]|uniref:Uncharacterized protein n=1 Tax=Smallanthus sonchifolius TaxID=185202 RepID=A0ACB9K002_9ASTR|nr:hypothetical protein L1987_07048 [Smallanthus sonchifolius]
MEIKQRQMFETYNDDLAYKISNTTVIDSTVLLTSLEVQDAGERDSSLTIPPITPLVHDAAPHVTAPPPPHSDPNATPFIPENEGTSNDRHEDNSEPDNQLRRSSRSKRPTNFDDYVNYLTEAEMDAEKFTDPTSYQKPLAVISLLNGTKL